jgi:hypothetical protein
MGLYCMTPNLSELLDASFAPAGYRKKDRSSANPRVLLQLLPVPPCSILNALSALSVEN